MKTARVFPRRTKATPDDILAFTAPPVLSDLPEIDEVHISVAFTYDMEKAEWLAEKWQAAGVPVRMGGPAFNHPGDIFVPGMYLKKGYVITSRGCPNNCWFCSVPRREGSKLRELPITEGYNILDDNLLACSEKHIHAVFNMLKSQDKKPLFTGGLESRLFQKWHAELLRESKAQRIYFAYDMPDDYEPLVEAGKTLREAGITKASHRSACYVLIGYPGDTMENAEKRLHDTWNAGFVPYAMLYRGSDGKVDADWNKFQRLWVRPEIIFSRLN